MDRNTLLGLGLIGVILALFTYFNQPSEAELAAQKEKQELAEQQKAEDETRNKEQEEENKGSDKKSSSANSLVVKQNAEGTPITDSLGRTIYLDTVTGRDTVMIEQGGNRSNKDLKIASADIVDEQTATLENSKIRVVLTNKGGGVKSVFLKEHQTYSDYEPDNENEEIEPLQLFDSESATNQLVFNKNGQKIETSQQAYKVKEQTDRRVVFASSYGDGQTIEHHYSIDPDKYHVEYTVKMKGFEGEVTPENVRLNWNVELLKTERLLSEQRRTSTVFFKENGGSYDYLSEFSDDQFAAETDVDWVAFKQSYFSSILMPKTPFAKSGTTFKVSGYPEGSEKDSTHIKQYETTLNLDLDNTNDAQASMTWFFGPNKYDLLSSYENESQDIINLGWGLFRWINIYAIQPIFTWLASFGMNLGLAILLLTLVVKLVLTPIQWKMYSSSAKMRILKPEIEEINNKFPNKEDAMKKQMETMTLYRESGASPLSGCVPMLIQMPILFAVFRFFPSSFTLRQEGFLWAEDLSSYDSVADLGFNIPFYGDHISLFTLLMAGTTLFYTVMNSSNMQQPSQPGMPNMKVIMYIFPIMMIFFFNNYASGLSFYYFVSTLISILTMLAIKNFFVDEDKLKAKMAARKASKQGEGGKKGKKSKFQERLEDMQKAQQEKLKNKKK
jgi:YidC/Oxa1 family membrane protein insertase